MNEELLQREQTEESMIANDEMATFEPFEMPAEGDVDLSDDDIAAALGFATTISEPLLPQDEMDTAEDEETQTADESPVTEEEAVEEETEEPEEGTDSEQDKEIAEIRAELEQLQEEVYGEKTEDTESTG